MNKKRKKKMLNLKIKTFFYMHPVWTRWYLLKLFLKTNFSKIENLIQSNKSEQLEADGCFTNNSTYSQS